MEVFFFFFVENYKPLSYSIGVINLKKKSKHSETCKIYIDMPHCDCKITSFPIVIVIRCDKKIFTRENRTPIFANISLSF